MSMNCDDWKAFHQDYVSGALSDAARAAVDRHLGECQACFGEVRLLKQVDTRLRTQPELPVPAGLVDRVMEAACPPEIKGRFGREFLRIAAAAVVVIGLGFAALRFAPIEKARPLTETSKSFFDAARNQVEALIR